jgi:hypothetical protein
VYQAYLRRAWVENCPTFRSAYANPPHARNLKTLDQVRDPRKSLAVLTERSYRLTPCSSNPLVSCRLADFTPRKDRSGNAGKAN